MEINKSTRHSKITGNFAEALVLYWLSKHGFECANIDHTGIDIIARNPHTKEIMGISVKSRSRNIVAEGTYISIPNDNFNKAKKACDAFDCEPFFAIVVDEKNAISVFILSMKHLLKLFPKGKHVCSWKMNKEHVDKYFQDKNIMIFNFTYKVHNWWKN